MDEYQGAGMRSMTLRRMRRFQAEEILRIGLHDVAGELSYEEVSAQLVRLAETCLHGKARDYQRSAHTRSRRLWHFPRVSLALSCAPRSWEPEASSAAAIA